jgi:ribonuclease HI
MREVTIYCDGACSGNPGPGGWAAIIIENQTRSKFKFVNGADHTTNNQMELAAAIGPLRFLSEPCQIDIYSDSEYLVKGMSEWLQNWKLKGWKTASKKPVANKELWQELDQLSSIHNITWHWTKGHANCEENNRVDELAYNEAQRRKIQGV